MLLSKWVRDNSSTLSRLALEDSSAALANWKTAPDQCSMQWGLGEQTDSANYSILIKSFLSKVSFYVSANQINPAEMTPYQNSAYCHPWQRWSGSLRNSLSCPLLLTLIHTSVFVRTFANSTSVSPSLVLWSQPSQHNVNREPLPGDVFRPVLICSRFRYY